MSTDDLMWPHFAPPWRDLRNIDRGFLLAGGYGLFLKQKWLLNHRDQPTLVALDRWLDPTPRVTKDLDLVVSVEIVATATAQEKIDASLRSHGYEVVPSNARWQFKKVIGNERSVIVDFHAPLPPSGRMDLRTGGRRVKPKPSMGEKGIHGRENPDAVGSELCPFQFVMEGLEVSVPNPVTWSVMKLAAVQDRWNHTQDVAKSSGQRADARAQFVKHARDVFRVVAAMTRNERDRLDEVIFSLRKQAAFRNACSAVTEFFGRDGATGTSVIADQWMPEDQALIQAELGRWFS
jgi:hypothetical protein